MKRTSVCETGGGFAHLSTRYSDCAGGTGEASKDGGQVAGCTAGSVLPEGIGKTVFSLFLLE